MMSNSLLERGRRGRLLDGLIGGWGCCFVGVDRVSNRTALNELPGVEAIHMRRMPAINVAVKIKNITK